ncbi:hypothetical protein CHS0354_026148 [Potamilus streckersoni]|uniref:Large ribosomal subunit protein eL36 n=1 Tax=Potamilus streckersoni TaxID=2493646 RepID=A0AAE0VMP4_9BIVA|nr:hypothetical protein CHS0354_026148 [Potamilus streckersoni]KAK3583559.1 hypothetical protein CHS0354_026148 [Potamilus streckersoni]
MGIQYDMAVGLKKGHKVTPLPGRKNKHSRRKGELTKKNKFIRDLVRDITGFAPYERRIQELLRISKDKRALKFSKKRLGTHVRAKRKREEMQNMLQKMRKAAQQQAAQHK